MARPRRELEPITFVTVERAFKPQIKVRATRDMSGWVGPKKNRTRWEIGKGRIGCIDADAAREYQVKGYVEILEGDVKPVSEDEAAEMLATMSVIGLGGS